MLNASTQNNNHTLSPTANLRVDGFGHEGSFQSLQTNIFIMGGGGDGRLLLGQRHSGPVSPVGDAAYRCGEAQSGLKGRVISLSRKQEKM